MNVLWITIRSSHALLSIEARRTYCGRTADAAAEVSEQLPAGRSCETCLRLVARKVDA